MDKRLRIRYKSSLFVNFDYFWLVIGIDNSRSSWS